MFNLFCYVRETHPRGKTRRAWCFEHIWIKQKEILRVFYSFLKLICLVQKWSISTCWSDFSFFSLPGKHSKGRRPADDGASERWYCCRYAWSSSCSASCSGAQLERASEWRRSGCDKMWQDCTNETTPIRTFQECGFWLIELCRKIEIHLGTRVDIFRQWATLVLRPSQASKQILQVQGFDAQQENNRKTFRSHHVITCSYIVLRFEFVDSELHLDLVDSCWFLFCMQVIGKDRKAKVVASRWLYPWLRSRKSWTRSGMPWKLVSKLKDRFCRQLKTIEKSNDYQIINNLVSWQKLFWFWEHKHGWHDDDMMMTWWWHAWTRRAHGSR